MNRISKINKINCHKDTMFVFVLLKVKLDAKQILLR